MIKPTDFVTQFAALTGTEETTVRTVDTSLLRAEPPMRTRSQGRHPADLPTIEALRIALGVAGARQLTKAADDVRDLEAFRLVTHGVEVREGSTDGLSAAIGVSLKEMRDLPLIEVLQRIALHIAAPTGSALFSMAWVKVDLGGPVTIQVMSDGFTGELPFSGVVNRIPLGIALTRSATLGPNLLAWIGHVTKDTAA